MLLKSQVYFPDWIHMPLVDSRTTMVNKSNAKKGRYFLKYTIYKREGKKKSSVILFES